MTIGNHPQSRGTVRLQSGDPHVPPVVDPKYMAEKEDVDAMIEAVRWGTVDVGGLLFVFWLKFFFGRSWECEVIFWKLL